MTYLAILFALACAHPEASDTTDTREPIAIAYVGAPELAVHKWATDDSPVTNKFLNGESVSVLRKRGDWWEVRTGAGSGWVHSSDLTTAKEAQKAKESPTAQFRHIPSAVTAPGTHGTIYIEANVNTDGDVTSTRVITNTTGSDDLAARNAAALERAKFYPIVQHGERKPFLYYYRVDY